MHAYILYINFKSTCMYFHIYICLSNSLIHVLHVCNFDPSWSNSYTTWQNIDMELISLVFTLLNFRSSYVTTVLLFFERGRWSIFFLITHLQELLLHDCIQYVKIARCMHMTCFWQDLVTWLIFHPISGQSKKKDHWLAKRFE